jgi:hypothetical protein
VAEDCDGEFAAWLVAVKAAMDFLTQFLDFSGIVRICHSLGKFGQFFTGQLAFSRQFHGESYDLGLFAGSQLLDFFNDACCGHAQKILEIPPHSNDIFKVLRDLGFLLLHTQRGESETPKAFGAGHWTC